MIFQQVGVLFYKISFKMLRKQQTYNLVYEIVGFFFFKNKWKFVSELLLHETVHKFPILITDIK